MKQWIVHAGVFSPKGEQDQGCIFCSAPPASQHRLCCMWHQGRWQVMFLSVCASPLHILVWTRFCPDKPSWEDVCEDIKIPSTWEPLAVLWPPSLLTFLHLSGRAAYPFKQNLCNETDAGLIPSLSPGLLPRVQTLPEDKVRWSQLQRLLEFRQGENFFKPFHFFPFVLIEALNEA